MLRGCFSFMRKHKAVYQQLLRFNSGQTPRTKPQFQSGFDPVNLVLICPLTCFGLCYWQLQRKQWKLGLKEHIKSRLGVEPQPLPENTTDLEELYPIRVRGHFDYTNEVYIGPKTMEDPEATVYSKLTGVHVVTPFVLADRNMTILVNRGFYTTQQFSDEEILKQGQHHGERTIVGYLRKDQEFHSIMNYMLDTEKPSEKFGHDQFLARILRVLAKRCGTSEVYLDAKDLGEAPKAAPKLVQVGADLRDKHTEYAVFWAALGAGLLYMFFRFRARKQKQISVKDFFKKKIMNIDCVLFNFINNIIMLINVICLFILLTISGWPYHVTLF